MPTPPESADDWTKSSHLPLSSVKGLVFKTVTHTTMIIDVATTTAATTTSATYRQQQSKTG